MWKVYFREFDKNGKAMFEGKLHKEYQTKANAAKLAKKFSEAHKGFEVVVAQEYPF